MRTANFLTKNVSLRLFDLAKGLTVRDNYLQLENILGWDPSKIRGLQQAKLTRLLRHAWDTVPYYRKQFEARNLRPQQIKDLSDLSLLPPLRRGNIQNSFDELRSTEFNHSQCYLGSSSGSTGQPVRYLRDKGGSSAGQAALYFGWGFAGWRFGDRNLTIWGNPTIVAKEWSRLSSRMKTRLFGEVKIPAFELAREEKISQTLEILRHGRFDFLHGYTNAIHLLACYAADHAIEVPRLRGVLTTAENLQPHQRRSIEKIFGNVYDFYGCGEINGVAFQCDTREGYHIIDPHVIVEYGEVIDNLGNQELLITDLDNYAMPLIRYANGDMGIPGKDDCRCGLPLSRIQTISGRMSDVIKTSDGGVFTVPSFFGSRLLKELHGLVRYQVELTKPDHILINLQTDASYTKEEEKKVTLALQDYIPRAITWEIKYHKDLQADKNGKFKLFVDRTKK